MESKNRRDHDEATRALSEAMATYSDANPLSRAYYERACMVFPGGNTRTSLFYEPFPLTMSHGEGCRLSDVDGHEYLDFLGDHTAGLFGHSHPAIRAAVELALSRGIVLGAQNYAEAELGTAICSRFESIELVRFTNSGTEANLMAISTACAITGRKKVLVFHGAFHGGVLSFSGGNNPLNMPFQFISAKYNDIDGTLKVLEQQADEVAAVIVEPMMGNAGCIEADTNFINQLRELTRRDGSLLIFDEVMTSRLAYGGLQEELGVVPDMTTLGKYIGGGLTCGAFGGSHKIMSHFDARNSNAYAHSGTFNNNVLTMSAGAAGLRLLTRSVISDLNSKGDALRAELNSLARHSKVNVCFTGRGSMINIHVTQGPIRNLDDAQQGNMLLRKLLFFELIRRAIWLGPGGLITLSLPVTDADCSAIVDAIADIFAKHHSLFANSR